MLTARLVQDFLDLAAYSLFRDSTVSRYLATIQPFRQQLQYCTLRSVNKPRDLCQ